VNTLAGSGFTVLTGQSSTSATDGTTSTATFIRPQEVAVDINGSVYISDAKQIRKIPGCPMGRPSVGGLAVSLPPPPPPYPPPPPLQNVLLISAHPLGEHTCALLSTGGVQCWGWNSDGQLGDGTTTQRLTPTAVSGLSSGVIAASTGCSHTCALLSTGGVQCWGWNGNGQLGDGTTTLRMTPTAVSGLSNDVIAISTGCSHTCALLSAGGVQCWGDNSRGQLGDGTTTQRLTPTAVSGLSSDVIAVAAGTMHTCALLSSGGAKCWGDNSDGQLGDGTTSGKLAATAVTGLNESIALAAGDRHTCALLASGGVECWGYDGYGQLGLGYFPGYGGISTPTAVSGLPSGVVALTAGRLHTCALISTGAVTCWGHCSEFLVSGGCYANQQSAVLVEGVGEIAALSAGNFLTCFVLQSGGTVQCMGNNNNGQLGDGTKGNYRSAPTNVL